ncbi:MAG: helix-turn-helix domain-containing protein [Saprospiraceae bacterium]|nr:helix-turn-helix domain-containing protein [Saprospiraceae bacterium]
MANRKLKTVSIDQLVDKHIGKPGTKSRNEFEQELRLDILGHQIKELRKSKNMTQEELGLLVGVKKAQISKIENNFTNARFETILKVFKALDTRINFTIEPAT